MQAVIFENHEIFSLQKLFQRSNFCKFVRLLKFASYLNGLTKRREEGKKRCKIVFIVHLCFLGRH